MALNFVNRFGGKVAREAQRERRRKLRWDHTRDNGQDQYNQGMKRLLRWQ
jgi:hypothetical protein